MSPIDAFYATDSTLPIIPVLEANATVGDQPATDLHISSFGPLRLPAIIFGAATLSHHYNVHSTLQSDVPLRTLEACLRAPVRYGIRAFDTSPYYGSSEVILGQILDALKEQFPRSSYKLMTKCGRYGLAREDFDYTPSTIRRSVYRSMERLKTNYLDVVYLHDVDFVAKPSDSSATGSPRDHDPNTITGEGDRLVLEAVKELFDLKSKGIVRAVGVTGYSVPVLSRLCTMIAGHFLPLDAVLSFSHLTLQNSTLKEFLPNFRDAKISQVISASPLCMGLLTGHAPPPWHPAPSQLIQITNAASVLCASRGNELASVALRFGLRPCNTRTAHYDVPIVIGLSTRQEVHEAIQALERVTSSRNSEEERLEQEVQNLFGDGNFQGWSWQLADHGTS